MVKGYGFVKRAVTILRLIGWTSTFVAFVELAIWFLMLGSEDALKIAYFRLALLVTIFIAATCRFVANVLDKNIPRE